MTSDTTALVTGASSGIGVHFARELAERRFNLVLSARRIERLEALRDELQRQFGVRVEVIPSDLDTAAGARQLFADCQSLPQRISLLVNNAGWGKFGPTLDQSLEEIESMIQVNVTSLTLLARLFGADMREQHGGYILNHASFSAIQPASSYSVYSGTKAYVLGFSQALREDLLPHRIRVSALCPGFFQSDFFRHSGQEASFLVRQLTLRPEHVARAGIQGVLRGQAVIIPGGSYKMLNLIMRLLPRTVATGLANFAVTH